MNQERLKMLVKQFALPVLMTLLGLILLVNPDSAAALAAKIIGWVLVIIGAIKAISMADRNHYHTAGGWIYAACCVVLGVFILKNPLILAEAIGRMLGMLLAIRGVQDIADALKQKKAGYPYRGELVLAVITLAAGVVLAVLPLTLTRTILSLCGLVAAVIGIVNILEKIRELRLPAGRGPDIIDADE